MLYGSGIAFDAVLQLRLGREPQAVVATRIIVFVLWELFAGLFVSHVFCDSLLPAVGGRPFPRPPSRFCVYARVWRVCNARVGVCFQAVHDQH